MEISRATLDGWVLKTGELLIRIMKGFQQGLKPQYTYEEFLAAGENQFKKLPRPAAWIAQHS